MKWKTQLLFLVIAITAGCNRFNGEFRFVNKSDVEIWVDSIQGFKSFPPVGVLIPGASAGAAMSPEALPGNATIYWSFESFKNEQKTTLSLSGLTVPKGHRELRFTFTKERKWVVEEKGLSYK